MYDFCIGVIINLIKIELYICHYDNFRVLKVNILYNKQNFYIMKTITFLLIVLTITYGYAQTPEGTWKMNPAAGAFGVGPNQGDMSWYANSAGDVTTRACFFDDEFVFNADGSFNNVNGVDTWVENWQDGAGDGCRASVAPHDGSNAATWVYDATANTLTLSGVGAYLGLAKVYNGGELTAPANAPSSITYTVNNISTTQMTLDISIGGGWWRYVMQKQGSAPSCTDGIMNGTETGVDCGGSCPNACLAQIDLPINFEGSTTDYTVTDFGGNNSSLVADPTNAANTVIQTIKTAGAQSWAGTTISTPAGLASAIPISASQSKMYVQVWSPDPGIPIMLKIETVGTPTQSCETLTATPVVAGWNTLEFDFSNERPGTAALNPSFTFNLVSIFFNFGVTGANARNSVVAKTYYFDAVSFNTTTLGTDQFEANVFKIFPNPTTSLWNIKAVQDVNTVQVYDVMGKLVINQNPNTKVFTINSQALNSGLYFAKMNFNGGTKTIKLIKK